MRKGLLLLRSGYVRELAAASYPHIQWGDGDFPCIAGGVVGGRAGLAACGGGVVQSRSGGAGRGGGGKIIRHYSRRAIKSTAS